MTHTAEGANGTYAGEFFHYTLGKMCASLAHLTPHMKGRAMCEIFGAYGYGEDSVIMKYLIDFLLVRGVNRFVPHAFSTRYPDGDCPPHFGSTFHPAARRHLWGQRPRHRWYGRCDIPNKRKAFNT